MCGYSQWKLDKIFGYIYHIHLRVVGMTSLLLRLPFTVLLVESNYMV